MLATLRKNALVSFCGACVLVYQGMNVINGDLFTPKEQWRKSRIGVKLGERNWNVANVSEWGQVNANDFSSKLIKGLGYSVKYLLDDYPDNVIKGNPEPYLNLTVRDEFGYQRAAKIERMRRYVALPVLHYTQWLESQGIRVVVVPVPTKVSVYRDDFDQGLPLMDLWGAEPRRDPGAPPKAEEPALVYGSITDTLGERAVNVLGLFRKAKASGGPRLFHYNDLHWTSYGLTLVAAEVARKVTGTAPEIVALGNKSKSFDHPVLNMLRLPPWLLEARRELWWEEPLYELAPARAKASSGRLILMGSSASEEHGGTPHRFGSVLARALGRELIEQAVAGGGAEGSLRRLVDSGVTLSPEDVVVWEFPMAAESPAPKLPLPKFRITSDRELTSQR
jgi:hypothetical protein